MDTLKPATILLSLSLGLAACSSGDDPNNQPTPPVTQKIQIKINASASATRVSDSNFDQGDRVGVFVVNYVGNSAGTLKASGNHVDNMGFTFSNVWTSDSPVYWKDDKTHADFYLYYPFVANPGSVEAMPFDVKEDQSSQENYKASELLIGKASDVAPTEKEVGITARHIMSQINIILEAADGFTSEDLSSANVKVKVNGIKNHSTANIITGTASATGEPTAVTPLYVNGTYKALIPPQTVGEGNLITVTADGRDFNLKKAFTFESGRLHKFTVRLSKTSNGINVSISPWEDDGTDNGGVAE